MSLELQNDIFITDLAAHGPAASARAWTPAFEFQYHFGKTGVNKFSPLCWRWFDVCLFQ